MHIVELSRQAFDKFALSHENSSFYQTSAYGALMAKNGYTEFYLGMMDDNNNLKAASMFIYRYEQAKIANIKYAYAPRGFILDYYDFETLKTFTNLLKEFLKSKKFTFVRIDPRIVLNRRDKKGNIIFSDYETKRMIDELNSLGYVHQGYNIEFESAKPRFEIISYNQADLFEHFDKNTKNKIRNAARKGLTVYKGDRNDLLKFYELVKSQKQDRPIEYYIDMYDAFSKKDMIDLYFVKLNVKKYLENMTALYQREETKNNTLVSKIQDINVKDKTKLINQKIASDKLLTSRKLSMDDAIRMSRNEIDEIIIGTALVIKYNKEIVFYITGYDKEYNMPINHILRWAIINKYAKLGYERFNLNAISGNFHKSSKYYGLLENKIGFAGTIHEYIGEFDLVLNQTSYQIYNSNKNMNFAPNISSLMRFKK